MADHTVNDLRARLFDALDGIKTGKMDLETAKVVSQVSQTIINLSRLEVDFAKNVSGMGTGFFPIAAEQEVRRLQQDTFAPSKVGLLDSNLPEEQPVVKVSLSQRHIIEFLMENGGESRVGVINDTRSKTIQNLEALETKGVIECVEQPPKLVMGDKDVPLEISQNCGTWKLLKKLQAPSAKA